jgi:hypothetical protein
MKETTKFLFGCTLFVFALISCRSAKETKVASYHTYETECLGVELDGSQTLRVWGTGKNKRDAVEQARKNAVHEVIFKGVRKGKAECNLRPLLLEVNAEEKHEDYFQSFFADNGGYDNYISMEDEKRGSKVSEENSSYVKYGIVVRVLRSKLKERLQKDGLIKQ